MKSTQVCHGSVWTPVDQLYLQLCLPPVVGRVHCNGRVLVILFRIFEGLRGWVDGTALSIQNEHSQPFGNLAHGL